MTSRPHKIHLRQHRFAALTTEHLEHLDAIEPTQTVSRTTSSRVSTDTSTKCRQSEVERVNDALWRLRFFVVVAFIGVSVLQQLLAIAASGVMVGSVSLAHLVGKTKDGLSFSCHQM